MRRGDAHLAPHADSRALSTVLSAFLTQPGDAGVFTCVATNTAGTARQDVRLSINMRPAFKELPADVTLNKGQSLALSCHAQGTPSPVISWTANNRPYPGAACLRYYRSVPAVRWLNRLTRCSVLTETIQGATVDESGRSSIGIANVTMSDAGTYVCIAENSVGSIRALSFVHIRGESCFFG